jgi:excisionase family DNA binding protein
MSRIETTRQSEPLWTIQEVASYLNVSQRTIERLRHDGRFPEAIRIGRSVRFEVNAIATWARSAREAA